MLDLAEIPFFAALTAASISRVRSVIRLQHYAQGAVIVRAGESGSHFQAIATGAVRALPGAYKTDKRRNIILGPGQVFGEMSLLTGMPVSATLIAARDTDAYCLDGAEFLRLLDEEPELHRSLTRVLIDRLHLRTKSEERNPSLVLLVSRDRRLDLDDFAAVLAKGVCHYEPSSKLLNLSRQLDARPGANAAGILERWRREAVDEKYLLTPIAVESLHLVSNLLLPEDVILEIVPESGPDGEGSLTYVAGAASHSRVYVGGKPRHLPGRWNFHLSLDEYRRARESGAQWASRVLPCLDHIVRYITFREIGVALSSGGARGFAHAGVLEVLEQNRIPVDFICGSSMGGVAALTIANSTSAVEGTQKMRQFLKDNRKIKDVAWWPRASMFSGNHVDHAARQIFEGVTFSDLRLPVAVVTTDLVNGDRTVLDSGPVVPAVLGTSAIPGFLPPIAIDGRILVDGAVVSRVPVDVLDRRRCGLRIAVNVVAPPVSDAELRRSHHIQLQSRITRFLGFKHVLGATWEWLGSYGANLEALGADLVVSPEAHRFGGPFDFDLCDEFMECGRQAARLRIDAIRDVVDTMLRAANG